MFYTIHLCRRVLLLVLFWLVLGSHRLASCFVVVVGPAIRSRTLTTTTTKLSSSVSQRTIDSNDNSNNDDDEEEWHPRDPAHTSPQLLAGLWHQIAQAGSMSKGESYTVIYPELEEELNQQPPRYLNNILGHLDYCKDVCDHFGMTTTLSPFVDQKTKRIVGFTAKSFQNRKDENDEFNFAYDPYWDDGTDYETLYTGIDDDDLPRDPYPEIVNKVPDDDNVILDTTKKWVQTMMSDMGICPFSVSAESAGLPIGPVHYEVTRCSSVEDMYVKYWEEVVRIEQQSEKELSTVLLIAPEFFMDNVELYESFSNTLTQPLVPLKVEELLQLVFFHPHWSFRDGGERATEKGQAANYARRSPWPMINILRTKQVRKAQRGIPTGLVYKQNEKTLNRIGVTDLETMLRLRDWSALDDQKVNRREMDAIQIAQDFQATGQVNPDDLNLAKDVTPVANRVVDRKQVEEGNLVNVLQQALEKRLGAHHPLSGPETSATSMATEYLLQELDQLTASIPAPPPTTTTTATTSGSKPLSSLGNNQVAAPAAPPLERMAARQAHLEKARRAIMEDLAGEYEDDDNDYGDSIGGRGKEMSDILFGRGGVQPRSQNDDELDAFRSFGG